MIIHFIDYSLLTLFLIHFIQYSLFILFTITFTYYCSSWSGSCTNWWAINCSYIPKVRTYFFLMELAFAGSLLRTRDLNILRSSFQFNKRLDWHQCYKSFLLVTESLFWNTLFFSQFLKVSSNSKNLKFARS